MNWRERDRQTAKAMIDVFGSLENAHKTMKKRSSRHGPIFNGRDEIDIQREQDALNEQLREVWDEKPRHRKT